MGIVRGNRKQMNAQRPTFNGGIRRRQGYGGRVKGQPTGPVYVSAKRTQIMRIIYLNNQITNGTLFCGHAGALYRRFRLITLGEIMKEFLASGLFNTAVGLHHLAEYYG